MKRRTEITVEMHRLLLVGGRRVSAVGWCAGCGARARLLTAEEAARLSRVTPRDIYRRVETGQLHFIEAQDGLLLICQNSLGQTETEVER
ncbi:MAG: hypothetical protein ACJ741_06005 [Pyrinomonadaceae bacterium]